jgi:nicotinamide-nucleotide amidase
MQGDQGDIEVPDEQELYKAAERVLDFGHRKGLTVGTAESCTGGLVTGALTAVPGSSAVVKGGITSYAIP